MKIVSLVDSSVGFLHATALSRALRRQHLETIVHIGHHTEFFQARAYFEHVDIVEPDVNLELGTNSHGISLGELLIRLERVLLDLRPDLIVVDGDSQATLAGALVAARNSIPLARLEAGVRSYNKRQPEEVNRALADRLADILFCDTHLATQRLAGEGIISGVHCSGDLEVDIVTRHLPLARQYSSILQRVGLYQGYYLLVVMRSDTRLLGQEDLHNVVRALNTIREPIVFPMAVQLRAAFDKLDVALAPHVLAIDPLGYLDMLSLETHARAIITDLDRMQRTAYHLAVPCITLCDDTEARETVDAGWNRLVGSKTDRIVTTVRDFLPPIDHPALFGDGHAADLIADVLSAQPIVFGQNYSRVAGPLLTDLAII